jgi:hypothetical protein
VSSGHPPPNWERLLAWLVVGTISLQLLARVLPRLMTPLIVLAVIFVIVRLVIFHTRNW